MTNDLTKWIGRKLTLPAEHANEKFGRRVEVIGVMIDINGSPYLRLSSVDIGRISALDPSLAARLSDN